MTSGSRSRQRTVPLPVDKAPATCQVVPERERVRVIPEGELDISTVSGLSTQVAELRQVGFSDLTVDLRRLTFMDACGVHLLLDIDADCRKAGGTLRVLATGPARRLLDLCKIPLDVSRC
jgi:anti-anti-sigma factor